MKMVTDSNVVVAAARTAPAEQALHDLPDWYSLLHVEPYASADDITEAYRRELALYDPSQARSFGDVDFATQAEERRAALDQAFAVLHDPQRRWTYDQQRDLVGAAAIDRQGISHRHVVLTIGGMLVALLALAGVWSATARTARTGPAVVEVNQPAHPFVLRTLDGGRFDLAAYRGKVVLVNFWGTWCIPCKQETPALAAADDKLRSQGLVIVGVDLFDGERSQGLAEQDVRNFVTRYGARYPIALDELGQVARDYAIYPIPVSYIIDRGGNVRFIRTGGLTTADVEELFRRVQ